jgi:hypothetical protein
MTTNNYYRSSETSPPRLIVLLVSEVGRSPRKHSTRTIWHMSSTISLVGYDDVLSQHRSAGQFCHSVLSPFCCGVFEGFEMLHTRNSIFLNHPIGFMLTNNTILIFDQLGSREIAAIIISHTSLLLNGLVHECSYNLCLNQCTLVRLTSSS